MRLALFQMFIFFIHFVTGVTIEASLPLSNIIQNMDQEDLVKTGFYKLTSEECKAFDEWAEWKSKHYFLALPKQEKHSDMQWYYHTRLREETSSEIVSIPSEDESHMIWDLAMALRFQHESEWLKELIEFYKIMGVQHFYLYNNLSNDDYITVLNEYIQAGELEVIEWPVIGFREGGSTPFDHAVGLAKGKARWLILADTDEFIFPLKDSNLIDFLKPYENYGGVTVQMIFYGTSNVWDLNPGELLIEKLTKRSTEISDGVKSIVKPHRVLYVDNPHFAHYLPGYFAVDENFNPIPQWSNEGKPFEKIRLNHYVFRTKKFLHEKKILRQQRGYAYSKGEPLPDSISPELHLHYDLLDEKLSEIEDLSIIRFVDVLKQRLFSNK
jgi:hypothetical protein